IEVQVRNVFLDLHWTIGNHSANPAYLGRMKLADPGRESEPGRAEDLRVAFAGEPNEFDRITQAAGEWLVDENGLLRPNDRTRLGQMRPTVHALNHDRVAAGREFFERLDDRDPVLVPQFGRESLDPRSTHFDIGTASLVTTNDARAGNMLGDIG